MTTRLALLGAGKIGDAIINLLGSIHDYEITVADRDPEPIRQLSASNVRAVCADCSDTVALRALLPGHDVVVSASPFFLTPAIATICQECRCPRKLTTQRRCLESHWIPAFAGMT